MKALRSLGRQRLHHSQAVQRERYEWAKLVDPTAVEAFEAKVRAERKREEVKE